VKQEVTRLPTERDKMEAQVLSPEVFEILKMITFFSIGGMFLSLLLWKDK
jgi:hypothetical protein